MNEYKYSILINEKLLDCVFYWLFFKKLSEIFDEWFG